MVEADPSVCAHYRSMELYQGQYNFPVTHRSEVRPPPAANRKVAPPVLPRRGGEAQKRFSKKLLPNGPSVPSLLAWQLPGNSLRCGRN